MKIGHFQCQAKAGDFDENLKTVLRGLEKAKAEKLEIVSFPESLLTGYFTEEQKARDNGFEIDGPEIKRLLDETKEYDSTFMVGFNELRDGRIYNSVIVAREGVLEGVYSKAFPCHNYFEPGRDFPVFKRGDLIFGVIICADGGYIEPARILSLKGARVIFAPHYNYIAAENLINHFQQTRGDHIGRARENGVWFVRGNNFVTGLDEGLGYPGVGCGDSYILDPSGEVLCRSQRVRECLISAHLDFEAFDEKTFGEWNKRSKISGRALGHIVNELVSDEA